MYRSLLERVFGRRPVATSTTCKQRRRQRRPQLELLEERCVLATFFVDDAAGFSAAVGGLTFEGTEDFESSTLAAGMIVSIDDSLAPGVPSTPGVPPVFPTGTNVAVGLTVQSNTLGAMPATPSPRGNSGLATASIGLSGTPTDQVSASQFGDSFDMLFGLTATDAVAFTPLVFDSTATDTAGTAGVRVFDTAGVLIGSLDNIPVATFTNPTTMVGVVAMPGEDIGRINIFATSVGAETNLTQIVSGADNINVYTDSDSIPPVLQSFQRQNPATSPTNADVLVFRATFSEDVVNVDAGDFAPNGTTATVTAVTPVSGSIYDLTVSGGDLAGLNGTVGLDLAGGQDITDAAGNALPAGEPAVDETYDLLAFGAFKTDALVVDNNASGDADVGDTIEYTVVINNSDSTDATGVSFADTLSDSTLVPGSITVTPIAFDDAYTLSGNTPITVSAAQGVLANDIDPDAAVPLSNTGLTAISLDTTGTTGVVSNFLADGSFTYTPPTGFTGTDTFQYTARDADNLDSLVTGTVTMTVNDLVWYVDSSAAGGGDGSFTNPFQNLTPLNGAGGVGDVDTDSDTIFVFEGTGADYTGGIELENNQRLVGEGAGLTVNNMTIPAGNRPTIANSGGNAITLASNNTIRGLDIGNSSGSALFGNSFGTLTAEFVSINNNTGAGISLSNGNLSATFDAVTANSTGSTGVNLQTNTGSITFAALNITATSGAGLVANNSGTITVSGAGNTISTTTGTAVNISNTTIGASGVTFQSVSSNGAASGIILTNTGTGNFAVTGNGTSGGVLDANNNASGGTIQNTTGDAISLTNTGPVTISQMQIGAAGALQNIDQSGIRASGVGGLSVNNTDFINASGDDAGGGNDFAAIRILNPVAGSDITLLNNLFNRSFEDHVRVENNAPGGVALGTITVSQNNFDNNDVSGQGNDAFLYVGDNGSNATINVTANRFFNSDGDHIQVALGGTADADVTIGGANAADGNMLSAIHGTVLGSGITLSSGAGAGGTPFSGDLTFLIQNNDIQDASAASINVNLSGSSTAGLRYSGTISDNTIGALGDPGSGGFSGIDVTTNGAGTINVDIDDNTIFGWDGDSGIGLTARDGSGRLEANVRGNTVLDPDPTALGLGNTEASIEIASGAVGGDTSVVLVNITGNTIDNPTDPAFGDLFFGTLQGGTVEISNYAGPNNNQAQIQSFIQGNNTGAPTVNVFQFGGNISGTLALPLIAAAFETNWGHTDRNDANESDTVPAEAPASKTPPAGDSTSDTNDFGATDTIADGNLSAAQLEWIVEAALDRWTATGLTAQQINTLESISFSVADLPGWYLGAASSTSVKIDADAGGWGWFVDTTPLDDSEFAGGESPAGGRIDLLTAVMHEMGHVLGLADLDYAANGENVMANVLSAGVRRQPLAGQADGAVADSDGNIHFIGAPITFGTLPAGKSVAITFQAVIDSPFTGPVNAGGFGELTNQGTVTANGGAINIVTDDPDTVAPDDATTTLVTLSQLLVEFAAGDLSITDPIGRDENITLRFDATTNEIIILDPNSTLDASAVAGAGVTDTPTEVRIDLDDITFGPITSITFNADGGDDALTVDHSLGVNPIPITYNGGTGATDNDVLIVTGGTFQTAIHDFTSTGPENSGGLLYDETGDGTSPESTITYTGLEPVDMTGSTITDLVFNLPGTDDQAILEDDGVAANGTSQIRSQNGVPTFETTTFADPSGSLTINMGGDNGVLDVAALPDFTAALIVDGQGNTDATGDAVNVIGDPAAGSLELTAEAINVNTATVTTTGTQTYNGPLFLAADVTFAGAGVTFNNTVDNATATARNLVVNSAGGAATTFNGIAGGGANGGLASLTTNADGTTAINASISTTGDQTYNDRLLIGNSPTLTAANITTGADVLGAANGIGNLTITTAGIAQLNGRFGFDPGPMTFQRLASLTVNGGGVTNFNGGGGGTANPTVATTGLQQYDNNSVLQANGVFVASGGDIVFNGNLDGPGDGIFSPLFGSVTFNGTVGAATPLTTLQVGNATAVNINTTTINANGLVRFDNITTDGVVINPAGAATTTITASTGAVNFGPVTAVAVRGTNDGEDSLVINAGTTAQFNGPVGDMGQRLNNLTINAAGAIAVNGGSVTTAGDQTYNNIVTLGADAVFTGNNGTFTAGSDGMGNDLTLNFLVETILSNATFPFINVNNFTTGGSGNTRLDGDFTTTGTQTYNDTVTLNDAGGNVVLTAANASANPDDNAITFADTVDRDVAAGVAQSLTLDPNGDSIHFQGIVGGILPLQNIDLTAAAHNVTFAAAVNVNGSITQQNGIGTTTFNGGIVGGNLDIGSVGTAGINDVVFNSGTLDVSGTVIINAANSIATNASDTTADVSGTTFNLVAGPGGIGTTLAPVDIDATTQLNADTSATGSNIFIDDVNTLPIGTVNAGAGLAALQAGTNITDATVTENANIAAASAALRAATGIGTLAENLNTAVTNLAFNNTGGDVHLLNDGPLTIGVVDGLAASSNTGGTTNIAATSPLTFAVNTSSSGTAVYTASEVSDSPTFADDITVNAGITVESTTGDLTLQAGDDVEVAAGSTASAAGALSLTAGFGDLDMGGQLIIDPTANLVGDPINLTSFGDFAVGVINQPGITLNITSTNGAILDGNDPPDGTLNITAQNLALSANTGIGGVGATATIETQVGNLEAATNTGGIFLSNTGDLIIGGVTGALNGLQVVTSGDIDLTNAGRININVAGERVAGPTAVTLTANGPVADILTGDNALIPNATVQSSGGTVTLIAERDLLLGDPAGAGTLGNVSGGGSVVLNAGRDITVDTGTFVQARGAGTIMADAGRNISVLDTSGPFAGAEIRTEGGGIMLTTGPGGVFTANNAASPAVQTIPMGGNGDITISADDMDIQNSIVAGAGIVTLQQVTGGQLIDLGTDTVGSLGLTDAELDLVSAGILRVGSATAGQITLSDEIDLTDGPVIPILHLITGADIVDTHVGDNIRVASLALEAITGIGGPGIMTANEFELDVTNLAASNTTSGTINIRDVGNLNITTVDGVMGMTNSGAIAADIAVRLFGVGALLTVDQAVTNNTAGNIFLEADDMALNASVSAAGQMVRLRNANGGRAIDLGNDTGGQLGLTDAELDNVTAAALEIGRNDGSAAGTITFSDFIDLTDGPIIDVLHLITGADIVDTNAGIDVAVESLALDAVTGIGNFNPLMPADETNDIDTQIANLAATTVTGDIFISDDASLDIAAAGVWGLTGVTITTGGAGNDIFLREGTAAGEDDFDVSAEVRNAGAGNITLFADGAETDDDLDLLANVTGQGGGNVNLVSGNDIDLEEATVVVSTTGGAAIEAHAGQRLAFDGTLTAGFAGADIVVNGAGAQFVTAGGNILATAAENVETSILNAGAGTVYIIADSDNDGFGRIEDWLFTGADSIIGAAASLRGGEGVGEPFEDLDLGVDRAAAVTDSGDINIQNSKGLVIGNVAGAVFPLFGVVADLVGATITDTADDNSGLDFITIRASSPLTINNDPGNAVTNNDGGSIGLAAQGSDPMDDLTVNANVTSIGGLDGGGTAQFGDIGLFAGDSISIGATAVVSTVGTLANPSAGLVFVAAGTDFENLFTQFNGTPTGEIMMADGAQIGTDEGVIVAAAPGNIQLSRLNADFDAAGTRGTVAIFADFEGVEGGLADNAGEVTDNLTGNGPGSANIIAQDLEITAATGIGVADPIDTAVSELDLTNTTSGDVNVDNDGTLTLVDLNFDGFSVNNAGGGLIRSLSPLQVADDAMFGADMTLRAAESAAAGDDLTVLAGVSITSAANLNIEAGDNITLEETSMVMVDGVLTIEGDNPNFADGAPVADAAGTVINILGATDVVGGAAGTLILGGNENDAFNIQAERLKGGSAATIEMRGGDDNLILKFLANSIISPAAGTMLRVDGGMGFNTFEIDASLDTAKRRVQYFRDEGDTTGRHTQLEGIGTAGMVDLNDIDIYRGRGGSAIGDRLDVIGIDAPPVAGDDLIEVGFFGSGFRHELIGYECLHLVGQNGNDQITNHTNLAALIDGGLGDDILIGGDGTDVIFGGPGRDMLFGRGGADYLFADLDADGNLFIVNNEYVDGGADNNAALALSDGSPPGVQDTVVNVPAANLLQEEPQLVFILWGSQSDFFVYPTAAEIEALRQVALAALDAAGCDWAPPGFPTEELGIIESVVRNDLNLAATGQFWFSFTATHTGTLTAEANYAAGAVQLYLFDGGQNEIGRSLSGSGQERIDANVNAGETYHLLVVGDSGEVDLNLVNMVTQNSPLTVHGTAGDDVFEFYGGDGLHFSVNGVRYDYDFVDSRVVTFLGGGGNDTIRVTRTSDVEDITVGSSWVALLHPEYAMSAFNVESIEVEGAYHQPWLQNLLQHADVNGDGEVNVGDALALVGQLRGGAESSAPDAAPMYYDANGDGEVNVADVLAVVAAIRGIAGGEGEAAAGIEQQQTSAAAPLAGNSIAEVASPSAAAHAFGQSFAAAALAPPTSTSIVAPIDVRPTIGKSKSDRGLLPDGLALVADDAFAEFSTDDTPSAASGDSAAVASAYLFDAYFESLAEEEDDRLSHSATGFHVTDFSAGEPIDDELLAEVAADVAPQWEEFE